MKRKWVAISIVVVAAGVLGLAGRDYVMSAGSFDAEVWRTQPGSRPGYSPRYAMAQRLVNERLQPGMSRAEILALLGAPDHTDGNTVNYGIGASPTGFDQEGVVLVFGADDRLTRAYITRY